jgi:hypothetical protein
MISTHNTPVRPRLIYVDGELYGDFKTTQGLSRRRRATLLVRAVDAILGTHRTATLLKSSCNPAAVDGEMSHPTHPYWFNSTVPPVVGLWPLDCAAATPHDMCMLVTSRKLAAPQPANGPAGRRCRVLLAIAEAATYRTDDVQARRIPCRYGSHWRNRRTLRSIRRQASSLCPVKHIHPATVDDS